MSKNTLVKELQDLDDSAITRSHWRIVITAGMGFFTDAYDLFVIGIVSAILVPIWHLTTTQLAILNGAALASAAFGALFFGTLADRFGRKKMYGIEIIILFFGAIFAAFSINFIWLLIARVIMGFGIGGDYPSSAVVASEFSGRKNRGFLVLLVFAMQAVGLIVGPLFASLLLALHIPNEWIWRILLGFGAIPAASVFYLRRRISETPRFLLNKLHPPVEVSRVISDLTGLVEEIPAKIKQHIFQKKWCRYLFGTAGAWFLLDVAFYGNGVSSVLILKAIDPDASLLKKTLISTLIFLCFAVPGYALAAKYIDYIGRKLLQSLGFIMIAICYLIIALYPSITEHLILFTLVFGLSFFFVNFGPNTTTFLIPSEIYPTHIRAQAHGFSAAIGKLGAFVGAFILPYVLDFYGLGVVMKLMVIVALLGFLITFLVPEMKQKSLDAVEEK